MHPSQIRKLHQTSPLTVTEPNDPPIIFWYSTTTPQKKQNIPLKKLPFPKGKDLLPSTTIFAKTRAVNLRFFVFPTLHPFIVWMFWFTSEKQASGLFQDCFWLLLLSLDIIFLILNLLNPPGPTEKKKKNNRPTFCQKKAENFGG